ncbi:hypothetical protein HJ588_06170 [Flexivirga sp. ID2601S]|uniref:DUF2269 family protein n=1 Tax=Flexivirga aerilata TaxID=1656889 RepID=A0A849AI18_9MICO|nr:hypothetical protein [Flexivirga aerilata]NNG38858.1 hypothetical protein [Flexivirga aerilata]
MRATVLIALVAAGVCWVWWARRRTQEGHLRRLVAAARGNPGRGVRATVLSQTVAAVLAIVVLGVGLWAEDAHRLFWVRIPLALAVIAFYVPFATALAQPSFNVKNLRRTPERRLVELGAPPEVARRIAAVGKPFAVLGSVIFLCSVMVLVWHHLRA